MMPNTPMRFRSDGEALIPANEQANRFVKRRYGEQSTMSESGHSMLEHGLLFSFVEHIWLLHWTDRFPDFENFRYYLSVSVGHCALALRLDGLDTWVNVMEAKSWSLPSCAFQAFNNLSRLISEWSEKNHGMSIEKWKENDREAMRIWTRTRKEELGVKGGKLYKLKGAKND